MEIIIGTYDINEQKKKEILNKKIELYRKNFINAWICGDNKRMIYYGIMYFYKFDKKSIKTVQELDDCLTYITLINKKIKELTFNEIINMFPIKKDFDGKKFESKDYFSTIEYLKQFNLDEKIGEEVNEFFWNYYNNILIGYSVKELMLYDMYRIIDGKESFMAEWARMVGVDTYKINEKQGYIYNTTTGKTKPYKKYKKRNKYIKIVK
jgi:hypothetical protein